MKILGLNKMEILSWEAAVYIGYWAVESSMLSYHQTRSPMEIVPIYQIALASKGWGMSVRIVQTLGFDIMEIRHWDTAV